MHAMQPAYECSDNGGNGAGGDAASTSGRGTTADVSSLASMGLSGGVDATLLCYVLVDTAGSHAFVSRFDFNTAAIHAAGGAEALPVNALRAQLAGSRALFLNGYAFDEFPGLALLAATEAARSEGCALLFDPGPRASHLLALAAKRGGGGQSDGDLGDVSDGSCDGVTGSDDVTRDETMATRALLAGADVLLLTEEEAADVTGIAGDNRAAAIALLNNGGGGGGDEWPHERWVIIKRGAMGAMLARRGGEGEGEGEGAGGIETFESTAFAVDVRDTVGCGDSFAGALATAYLAGAHPSTALAMANAMGAATASAPGAGRNVGTHAAVRALLARRASGDDARAAEGDRSTAADALELLDRQGHQEGRAAVTA